MVTAWLIETRGWNVFSPITHSHPLHELAGLRGDWAYWEKVDRDYLRCSCRIVNLTIPGWRDSTGVCAERQMAREQGLPAFYVTLYPATKIFTASYELFDYEPLD